VRWQHPERGWLPPSEFVPFAESSGRIRLITQWMLTRAAQTLARWQAEGVDLYIAVNVTTLDIQDLGLPERVRAVLAEYRVDPRKLQLEVTETGLMASGNDPITVMHGLRRLGVRLAIDDFGTGQSSLGYLQRLPVDELKVDRSFVENAHLDPKRRALLSAIVGIGHSLGLTVTGEGVESLEELGVVGDCGCDLVQGFHVARPLDLDDFEAWRLDPDNDELFRAEWQRSAFA
jgi:EAL domain-containing protein (putative c-di-GMP-specific phosphodiesterase class I)